MPATFIVARALLRRCFKLTQTRAVSPFVCHQGRITSANLRCPAAVTQPKPIPRARCRVVQHMRSCFALPRLSLLVPAKCQSNPSHAWPLCALQDCGQACEEPLRSARGAAAGACWLLPGPSVHGGQPGVCPRPWLGHEASCECFALYAICASPLVQSWLLGDIWFVWLRARLPSFWTCPLQRHLYEPARILHSRSGIHKLLVADHPDSQSLA